MRHVGYLPGPGWKASRILAMVRGDLHFKPPKKVHFQQTCLWFMVSAFVVSELMLF